MYDKWTTGVIKLLEMGKICKVSFSRVHIFKSKTSRTKLHHIFKKNWLKLYTETVNINFKLIIRGVRILVFDGSWFHFRIYPYFETITGFQLMSRFWKYPDFETITGIHININF